MDNMYMLVSYTSVNGGVNNLQVVKVVTPSPYSDKLVNIVKTFWSKNHKAIERAEKFIRNNAK
jgi:hypothetical protein